MTPRKAMKQAAVRTGGFSMKTSLDDRNYTELAAIKTQFGTNYADFNMKETKKI